MAEFYSKDREIMLREIAAEYYARLVKNLTDQRNEWAGVSIDERTKLYVLADEERWLRDCLDKLERS